MTSALTQPSGTTHTVVGFFTAMDLGGINYGGHAFSAVMEVDDKGNLTRYFPIDFDGRGFNQTPPKEGENGLSLAKDIGVTSALIAPISCKAATTLIHEFSSFFDKVAINDPENKGKFIADPNKNPYWFVPDSMYDHKNFAGTRPEKRIPTNCFEYALDALKNAGVVFDGFIGRTRSIDETQLANRGAIAVKEFHTARNYGTALFESITNDDFLKVSADTSKPCERMISRQDNSHSKFKLYALKRPDKESISIGDLLNHQVEGKPLGIALQALPPIDALPPVNQVQGAHHVAATAERPLAYQSM